MSIKIIFSNLVNFCVEVAADDGMRRTHVVEQYIVLQTTMKNINYASHYFPSYYLDHSRRGMIRHKKFGMTEKKANSLCNDDDDVRYLMWVKKRHVCLAHSHAKEFSDKNIIKKINSLGTLLLLGKIMSNLKHFIL